MPLTFDSAKALLEHIEDHSRQYFGERPTTPVTEPLLKKETSLLKEITQQEETEEKHQLAREKSKAGKRLTTQDHVAISRYQLQQASPKNIDALHEKYEEINDVRTDIDECYSELREELTKLKSSRWKNTTSLENAEKLINHLLVALENANPSFKDPKTPPGTPGIDFYDELHHALEAPAVEAKETPKPREIFIKDKQGNVVKFISREKSPTTPSSTPSPPSSPLSSRASSSSGSGRSSPSNMSDTSSEEQPKTPKS